MTVTVPLFSSFVTVVAPLWIKLFAPTPVKVKPVCAVRVRTALYTVKATKFPLCGVPSSFCQAIVPCIGPWLYPW